MTTPEQKARANIDAQLRNAGWTIQDKDMANPAAAPGVAIREYPTSTGPADYVLFVDQQPVRIRELRQTI